MHKVLKDVIVHSFIRLSLFTAWNRTVVLIEFCVDFDMYTEPFRIRQNFVMFETSAG